MFNFRKNKNKGKEKHEVIYRRKENENNKDIFSDVCAIHPEKTLDLFCPQCDKVCCRECKDTGLHKRGKYHQLRYLTEVAYEFEHSKELKEYEENMLELRRKIQKSCEKTAENFKVATQLQQVAEERIKDQKQKLIELIEAHYRDIMEKNKMRSEDCLSKLTDIGQQNSGLEVQFEEIKNEIHEKEDSMIPFFIAIKRSKEMIQRIEGSIRTINENNIVSRYSFEAGEQALTFMENKEDFGDLVEENLDSLETSSSFDSDEPIDTFNSVYVNFGEQISRKGALQRTNSVQSLPSTVGRFREYPEPLPTSQTPSSAGPTGLKYKDGSLQTSPREAFQRSFSMRSLPSTKKPLQYPTDNFQPRTSDTDFAMMEDGQFSDSKEPLNSLSTRSGTMPKIKPAPPIGPKPPAKLIKQARERRNSSYGFEQHNVDQQTQDAPEKYKVLHPYKPDNAEELSFNEGDIVTVVQKCTNVFAVELNGQQGYIPKLYLEEIFPFARIRSEIEKKFRPPEKGFP